MGSIYKCCCKACSNDFTIYDGDGMHSIGLICNGCGKRSSVPRQAPRPPREGRDVPSFLQTSRFYSLPPIPNAEIKRFTDVELKNLGNSAKTYSNYETDFWDDFELAALVKNKNPCNCGGTFQFSPSNALGTNPHLDTRCPICKSKNINFISIGCWD